ncbi:MAG: NYN domain-containing protein [Candidatus Odinarchaeota archaeon]
MVSAHRDTEKNTFFPRTAAVLFDGGYWENTWRDLGAYNVDLLRLSDELCLPAYRLRSYYFDGKTTLNKRQSFHDGLRFLSRFEVILGDVVEKRTECPHCLREIFTSEQKRVDVLLAVQMVHLATTKQVDLIVLVAGDRDFIPSVEIAKHSGVIVKLVHGPRKNTSTDLRQLADETFELTTEILQKFLRKKEKKLLANKRVISATRSKPQIAPESKNVLIKKSEDLIQKALKNTPPSPDGSILASSMGLTLSNIEPDWKVKYGVKDLRSFIERNGLRIVTPRWKGKVLHLHPVSGTVTASEMEKERLRIDPAAEFMVQVLKDLQQERKTDEIGLALLGIYMTRRDPAWKKRYQIKKLDMLVERAGDKVRTSGEGVDKKVGLIIEK